MPMFRSGSSPRLWGTPRKHDYHRGCCRFIPTPVGNTAQVRHRHDLDPVHPHACGEHRHPHRQDCRDCRFIPTPVGNTMFVGEWMMILPVHPHACGEHLRCSCPQPAKAGSSPRLWGTLAGPDICRPNERFIPTPVGNTKESKAGPFMVAVHPHACGEHIIVAVYQSWPSGSSPRLWGTLRMLQN